MLIDGVKVNFIGIDDATAEEAQNYVNYVRQRATLPVHTINVTLCPDGLVDVSYSARGEKFERIRRITGYLVGDLAHWNDSKQAEERDRVKHL